MTKSKTTKRALLSSCVALMLCFSMLLGTTYAWFTDSETSANNIIKSGTLDVEMYWNTDNGQTWTDAENGAIFNYQHWEPGYTDVKYIKVDNKGTLAFKYELRIIPNNQSTDALKLAEAIDVYAAIAGENFTAPTAAENLQRLGTLADLMKANRCVDDGVMLPVNGVGSPNYTDYTGEQYTGSVTVCLALKMQEEAGNEYQGLSIGDGFAVQLMATQLTYENDSFGPNYDADAIWPAEAVVVTQQPTVDATTKTATLEVKDSNNDDVVSLTIPAEAVTDEEGEVQEVTVTYAPSDETNVTVESDQDFIAFDLNVEGIKDGAVIVFTQNIGEGLTGVKMYHKENAMTPAATAAEVDAANEYHYNAEDGTLTYALNDYSPFTIVYDAIQSIGGKSVLYSADALEAALTTSGDYMLGADIELDADNTITVPAGVIVSLELNGKSITMESENAVSMITNKGTLTINGSGKIAYTFTGTPSTSVAANTIANLGVLVVNGGEISNTGSGNQIGYVIDNYNGSTLTVNGGKITATGSSYYDGIRLFCGTKETLVTVNGGEISSIWAQNPSNNKATEVNGTVVINGGTVSTTYYENYTTVKVKNGVTATVTPYGAGKENVLSKNENGYTVYSFAQGTVVATADALVAALEKDEDVVMTADIKIDPANMSNAYGKTGINVKNGQTIDGNGHTLDIKGAGGTWDSGINTTGGVIKNITVTGSFRGIFINHNSTHSEKVVLENVTIDGTTYTISCDQGMEQGLTATDSTFNGWTSYAATLGDAKFVDCFFGEGNGYAFCRPYAPTEFVGCEFEAGFKVDPIAAVTFENCTLNGVALTADNLAELVTNTANATVK